MTEPTWHVPSDVIARFADDPTRLDPATGSSVETHLVACRTCRDQLNSFADQAWLEASWDGVADRVDRPRRTTVERILDRTGMASGPARLLSATPGLRAASLATVAILTTLAVLATRETDSLGAFLTIAPLVPLAAIGISFAPATDPLGETGMATAMIGPRLTLIRVAAALVTSFVVLAAGGLALPQFGSTSFLWAIPGLALAFGSLALGTWLPVERAAVGLAAAWLIAVGTTWQLSALGESLSSTALFEAPGQVTLLALAAAGAAVLAARIDRYSTLEVRS